MTATWHGISEIIHLEDCQQEWAGFLKFAGPAMKVGEKTRETYPEHPVFFMVMFHGNFHPRVLDSYKKIVLNQFKMYIGWLRTGYPVPFHKLLNTRGIHPRKLT